MSVYLLLHLCYCSVCTSCVLTHHCVIAVNSSFASDTVYAQLMTFFFFFFFLNKYIFNEVALLLILSPSSLQEPFS